MQIFCLELVFKPGAVFMFYFLCFLKQNSYIQKRALHNFPLKKTLNLGLKNFFN